MNQRSLVASIIVLALLASVIVFGGSKVINQRGADVANFSSILKTESTNNLETISTNLTKLETEIKTPSTSSDTREVQTGDKIRVNYIGWLAKDGTVFDQSFTHSDIGFVFTVGQGVIPGWSQGVIGMKVGEVRRLKIPSNLGYGAQANGSIPANSDLIFDVELISFEN